MRNITEDQCNSTEEVCGLFRTIFTNQEQMEAKIVQNAQEIEALKPKKGKSKMKSKGSASMRVIAILMLIVALAGLSYAVYVPTDINSEIAANHDTLAIYLRDVLGNMASDAYLFNPRGTAPQSTEGRVYYDSGTNALLLYNGTTWQTLDAAGGLGLNAAYDFGGAGSGATIDTTDGPVVMAATEAGNNISLLITQGDSNGSYSALRITSAGAVANDITIDIDSQSSGRDIEGTGATWYVTGAGIIVGVSGDFTGAAGITLQNDETILNDTDHEIQFGDNGANYEDISFVFGNNNNIIGLATDTSADTFDFGVIDALAGVGGITFDAAASVVTLPASGDAQDLTISVTNAHDSSLVLVSAGTAADAISIDTTAGGITIDVGGTASAGEDFAVTTTTSIHLIGGEDATDAVNIDATGTNGGIDLDTTNGPITLTTAGADNGDITLNAADIMTLTSTDYKMFDGAATEVWRIDGTAAGSYHTISFTDATANVVWTFPDGGAGTVGIMSTSLATNFVDIANSVTGGTSEIIFEGSDADTEETIIRATDPTADIIWLLPNGGADTLAFVGSTLETNYPEIVNSVWFASNEVRFEGGTADAYESVIQSATITGGTVVWTLPDLGAADTLAIMGSTLATNAPEIADSVTGGTNQLIFEGSSADAFETILTVTDATADRTITFPNKTGQVMLSSAASAMTPGTTPTLTIGLSNLYTMTPTDNEDQTITFSGAGTSGDVITIVFTTISTGDEVITFHATLVSSTGTLTVGTTAARYFSITFISNGSHWYEVSRTGEQT